MKSQKYEVIYILTEGLKLAIRTSLNQLKILLTSSY
jgi:hypothetical protein